VICKICGRDVQEKFYLHLNSCHKMKKCDYLAQFPEQNLEYDAQKPPVWNKGLTAGVNSSVAKIAVDIKNYCNQPNVRQFRSDGLRTRYDRGDILSIETRAKVVKSASNGWIQKLKLSNDDERRSLLQKFTTAGNEAQKLRRDSLTPDDYNKLYPFAKGIARYHNCDHCGKQIIAWFGGKPRPQKRFCNQGCWFDFLRQNPFYVYKNNVIRYYSQKMKVEFCLRSKLELWLAELFDEEPAIKCWCTTPFWIDYEWLGRPRRYYPDFFVNENCVIEVKSDYVRKLQGEDRTVVKIKTADEFCLKRNYGFCYWQFGPSNVKCEDVKGDPRVIELLQKQLNT